MHSRHLLFKCSIAAGVLLSLLLVVETVRTFRYVQKDLIREEARRESDRYVQSIVHLARERRIEQSSGLSPLLRELARENPRQIAWIRVLAADGSMVADSDDAGEKPKYTREDLRAAVNRRAIHVRQTSSEPVLIVLSPVGPGPDAAELAMYRSGISVNFGPLRQDLIVGLCAAFALLGTVIVIGLRFGGYIRSKQIEKELGLARQVQFDLFPRENSVATEIDFAAKCVPAWEVGGDLYDVFGTDRDETSFVLGDVSGKGLSAALIMGVVQGAVRASSVGCGPMNFSEAAGRLNRLLVAKTARERFVTLFWATFNSGTGVLRYVNAGHPPPLLARTSGEILRLEAGGPILGMLADARYEYGEIAIKPGDLLVAFSDGIIEAADAGDEEFGEERLSSVIGQSGQKTPAEICNGIVSEVKRFLGSLEPQDDQTLVVVRLEPAEVYADDAHFITLANRAA